MSESFNHHHLQTLHRQLCHQILDLFANTSNFVAIDSKTNSIKTLKSPAATSHAIHNNPFQNSLCQIGFDKIIKINTIIDICLPNSAVGNLRKSSPRGRLTIQNCKGTFEADVPKVHSWNKHKKSTQVLENCKNNSLHRGLSAIGCLPPCW